MCLARGVQVQVSIAGVIVAVICFLALLIKCVPAAHIHTRHGWTTRTHTDALANTHAHTPSRSSLSFRRAHSAELLSAPEAHVTHALHRSLRWLILVRDVKKINDNGPLQFLMYAVTITGERGWSIRVDYGFK